MSVREEKKVPQSLKTIREGGERVCDITKSQQSPSRK
jgi:hypothetical protein